MTESVYVSLLPSDWPKVDFIRETRDWPKCADPMEDWTMRKYHNPSHTSDFYVGPGSQKLSYAAFHYRLNVNFQFKRAVIPISTNPDCFLEVIDHNRRQIMIFSVNHVELVAGIPILGLQRLPPWWAVADRNSRILTLDVDSVNLDLFCSVLQCTGSLTGGEGFTSVIGKGVCLLNLREFLAIEKRFKIPAKAIKRAFGAWQDNLPKDCPVNTIRGLLALWLRLGPVAKFRFNNLVQELILNSFKPVSTGPFPETTLNDDELFRQLCRRIDDIRRLLKEEVIDYIVEERWKNCKSRMKGWDESRQAAAIKGYIAAQIKHDEYEKAHAFPGQTGSINELLEEIEASFISYWGCEEQLIDTDMTLSQHPWGFRGFCVDCLKRSLEHGTKSTAEHGYWNDWVNSEIWSDGCTGDHGFTVFIDSFLGPSGNLKALIMEKWSKVEFDLDHWQQSLADLKTVEKVFCLRHNNSHLYAPKPEKNPFVESFFEAFARKHHFSISHVRALFAHGQE